MGGEDRLVERALHAAFEAAVDIGVTNSALILGADVHRGATSLIVASVSVPVLSVHSTSIAPRSWIAERRFTITFRFDISIADRASVTVTIIGRSSGCQPDSERQREHQRLEHRPMEHDIGGDYEQHEEDR